MLLQEFAAAFVNICLTFFYKASADTVFLHKLNY